MGDRCKLMGAPSCSGRVKGGGGGGKGAPFDNCKYDFRFQPIQPVGGGGGGGGGVLSTLI